MTRSSFLIPIVVLLGISLSGCAEAPVKVGDNNVEKPLQEVTGLTTAQVEQATQKTTLNLWDAYAMAVKHTEDLANQYETIEQAQGQNQQAVASVLPQVSLNDRKTWQSTDYIVGAFNPLFNSSNNVLYLSGAETILSGFNQVAAIQGAQAQLDENHHLFQQEARNLLLNVARAYYGILQAQDSLQSQQQILQLTQEILQQEQQWKSIGRSRESDVLTTEAQLAQITGNLETLHGQLSHDNDSLSLLTGLKSGFTLQSEEQAVPPAYTMQDALAKVDSRSDVKAAQAAVDVTDAQLLQAHGLHAPSLALQGQYYLQDDGSSPTPYWTVQFVASLPVFDGGSSFAQENIASSKKRQAELQYSLIHRQAVLDVQGAYSALATSLREVDAYSKALDAAQKDYAAVERDRKLALNTNLDVLQALTQLQNAQNNYNQAHYQALINWVWLDVATGDLPKLSKKGQ